MKPLLSPCRLFSSLALAVLALVPGVRAQTATPSPQTPATGGSVPAEPLKGKVIVIDPGHNGQNYKHPAEINKQAASSTIPLQTLQRAFQNIYSTMDAIDTFKAQALTSMKTTVDTLSTEVEKSKGYIARAEGANQQAAQIANNDLFKPV